MKLVVGIVIGALLYYYFPSEVETAISRVGEVVHEGAAKAAEATKPESDFDKVINAAKEKLQ
jgi:Na+/H+-translocating membrane pyrophosphatase